MDSFAYLLFIIVVLLIAAVVGSYRDKRIHKYYNIEKCKIHSWVNQEQVGMPGIYFMKCAKCGMFPGVDNDNQ